MIQSFFKIFLEEWNKIFNTPRLLIILFGVPFFVFFFYSSLLQQGVPTKLPVAILDQDKSPLSRQMGLMFSASATIDLAYNVNDELEGQTLVRKNDAYAFIIIPKGFQRNILKGNYTSVSCYYNGQYLLSGAIILKDFQTVTQTMMAGVVLETLEEKGLSPDQAMSSILPINTVVHVLYNPYTSYSYYLNVAFMPMALQIMVMIMAIYTFGLVLKQNKGQELLAKAGGKVYIAIFGKILPYTVVFFALGFLMNAILYYKIGTPLQGSFLGVNLIFFAFVIVLQSVGLFIAAITTSFRTALTIGGDYTALAFSFAGYTFPAIGMSKFIQVLCFIFPFTSYMRFVVDYGIRGIAFNDTQKGYIIALGVFALFGIIGVPLYHKKLKKGHYNA
ncbi:ABC transporter permease [Sphingobacterium rhinopitheci]|uniref:ABC transporter permease n=1 Tax=Sphingobacterium rhinopitheci TaxID=2781960 RepID=UPI001F523246|nr:ABC transporter permease [Sphingobacterium rhinopitheci]MCI0922324.1 ABC transporter permease [Sphingobacterium rhinopitheci]